MTPITLPNGRTFKIADGIGQARRNDASHPSPISAPKKPHKYGARSVVIDGIRFPSKREGDRWLALKLRQVLGEIRDLKRQVVYELAPAVRLHGEKRLKPALRYVADFRYFDAEKGHFVVEDAKGRDTPVSRIKRHLMKSVHGVDVVIS